MRALPLLLILLSSCGGPEETPRRTLSVLPSEAGPLDALNRRHARLRQRMRRRGYVEEVSLSRSFVLEERGVVLPLDLRVTSHGASSCSTFIALGGGSIRELALTLYDGDGEEAATESVEGEGGLLHVCPQAEAGVETRPYYLVLQAVQGGGAIMVAHFRSAAGTGEGFDGLFEGVLAPRVPFRDVEEHLVASRTALRARGFSVLSGPLLVPVTEGAVVRLPVILEGEHCYVATARSGVGLADIDLFLFNQAGVEVARDLAADAEPSIEICPDENGHYTVELRAFEGAGAVGMMVFEGPAVADDPGSDVPEERSPSSAADVDPSLALDVLAAPLRSRGFSTPLFVSRRALIVPGEVRTHDVVVGPGCALIAGTASDEGMDLDLYLADASGREVDRDTAVQSTPRVRACRTEPTVLTVAVKGYGRDGTYALAVLRAPSMVETLLDLRMEEVTAPYRARGYRTQLGLNPSLSTGASFERDLPIEAGRCVAIAAAGGDGVFDVDITLRNAQGQLLARESGPAPYAAATRCVEERESLTIEVTLTRGEGDVSVAVLTAPVVVQTEGIEPATDSESREPADE